MSSIVIAGDTSGSVTLQAPATAGTTVLTLPATSGTVITTASGTASSATTATTATNLAGGSNGTIPYQSASGTTQMLAVGTPGQLLQTNGAGAPTWVAAPTGGFTLGTPVDTTSGTAVTFTSIPAGIKQLIVNFSVFGIDAAENIFIQLGTSSGIETTGYKSASARITSSPATGESTDAFLIRYTNATNTLSGSVTFTLQNSSTNTFVASGTLSNRDGDSNVFLVGGNKALAGVLDRVKITSSSGTANFDSGAINIAYI